MSYSIFNNLSLKIWSCILGTSSFLKINELFHLEQSQLEVACLEVDPSSLLKIHDLFYLQQFLQQSLYANHFQTTTTANISSSSSSLYSKILSQSFRQISQLECVVHRDLWARLCNSSTTHIKSWHLVLKTWNFNQISWS
jgi:hypothetical protein